ncbi:MAG TPA: SulP family inorganic anion transporter, partial [Prosthecobacter sp.]|nr:SulP family inorganic anion transporter [Prosthecobacter sp.]
GTFEAFLVAVVLAGALQILLGICRAGFIAAFFPSSVIKGLLAAIGIIIVLKQIPHLLGRDMDPMGEKSFLQPDGQNTFTELLGSLLNVHAGALAVGIISILLMVFWDKITFLKRTRLPSALVAVLVGVGLVALFRILGGPWMIEASHLVSVPVTDGPADFLRNALIFPDWSALRTPAVYLAAITIAIVASLETLLNIEAVDKIDPAQRSTPPNRELVAQGVGNVAAGLIGGLPMTSVIIRSSVNINAGAKTKASTITHGALLLACVALVPAWLNQIPLAALAAILLLTGLKLASPKLIRQMWNEGSHQFVPFIVTIVAIVFTDLLIGVLIGLAVSVFFILHSNFRRPLTKVVEQHATGDVLRVELANQVSFFSRPSLEKTLREVPSGGHILLDARNTDYIDADVLDLISDFKNTTARAHNVKLSLTGFKDRYPQLRDEIQYVDFTSREVQSELTPQRVLKILQDGNSRFLSGKRLTRDLGRQVGATAAGQFPMAVVLSCIDSRTPAEIIFDLGLGDIFSVRIAGNIARDKVLGSMEYSCAVAGAKVIVVMGHTSCGAVNAAVDLLATHKTAAEATGCGNLDSLITEIQQSVDVSTLKQPGDWLAGEKAAYANEVSRRNVLRTMRKIRERSATLDGLVREGKLAIVGSLYDVQTGRASFFQTNDSSLVGLPLMTVAGV